MAFEYPSTISARKKKKQKKIDDAVNKAEKTFDKKFIKLAESKETQLHADDFDAGISRAEKRAASETIAPLKKLLKKYGETDLLK